MGMLNIAQALKPDRAVLIRFVPRLAQHKVAQPAAGCQHEAGHVPESRGLGRTPHHELELLSDREGLHIHARTHIHALVKRLSEHISSYQRS